MRDWRPDGLVLRRGEERQESDSRILLMLRKEVQHKALELIPSCMKCLCKKINIHVLQEVDATPDLPPHFGSNQDCCIFKISKL